MINNKKKSKNPFSVEKFPIKPTNSREWLQIGKLPPVKPVIELDACWKDILPNEAELLGSVLETMVNTPHPYTHQKEAFKHLLETKKKSKDLILNGGTYSGKSLSFTIPGLVKLLTGEINFMVIFYPSKQLLMDQFERMKEMVVEVEKKTGVRLTTGMYSGDTGKTEIQGRTTQNRELHEIEANPPDILLATFDKVWSQLLRGNKKTIIEKILNCQYMVFDEIHAFEGFAAAIIRLFIQVQKMLNPECQVVLSSATIDRVIDFRDSFLPDAGVITCPPVRGEQEFLGLSIEHTISLLVDLWEELETLPGKACLVFADSKEDIEILADRLCSVLRQKHDFFDEESVVVIHADVTYAQRKEILDNLQKGEQNIIRIVISSSVLELGVNIANIQSIVNIGIPITQKDGIVQRMARNRTKPGEYRVNFFIFDLTNARDRFYWEHKEILREILKTSACNPILYPNRNSKVFAGILILLLRYGVTDFQEIMNFFLKEGVVPHEHTRQQYARLVTQNILKKADGKILFTSKGEELLLEKKDLVPFSIRAIDPGWTINQMLGVDASTMDERIKQVGKITTRDVLRKGRTGNVLTRSRQQYIVEDFDHRTRQIFVKKYLPGEGNEFVTPPMNRLREPSITVGLFPKTTQGPELFNISFGQLTIERTLKALANFNPNRRITSSNSESHNAAYFWQELTDEEAQEYAIREIVEGIVFSLKIESLKGKSNKRMLQLFGKMLLIETEIILGIPSSEFGLISNNKELTLFDKGRGKGNACYLYKHLKEVAEQLEKRLADCSCKEGCKMCYGEITGELPKGSKEELLRLTRDLVKIAEKDLYSQLEEQITIQPSYQEERIIALSDIHLGSEFSYEEEFYDALSVLSQQADILIINGDLLDKGGKESIEAIKKLLQKAIREGFWSKLVLVRSSTIHDSALANFANIMQQDYAWLETAAGEVLFVHGIKIGINPNDVKQTNAEGATIVAKGKLTSRGDRQMKARRWLPIITRETHLVIGHLHERFYNEKERVYGLGHWTKKGKDYHQQCLLQITPSSADNVLKMMSYRELKNLIKKI